MEKERVNVRDAMKDERDKGRRKEGRGRRYQSDHSPLNFNGLFH